MEVEERARYAGNCPKHRVSPLSRKKSTRFVVSLEHSSGTGGGSRFKAKGCFVLFSAQHLLNVQNSLLHAIAKTACTTSWINARRGLQLRTRVCEIDAVSATGCS